MKITIEKRELIKALRANGMKQKEIASRLGISQRAISYWTNEVNRSNSIKRARINFNRLTEEDKRKIYAGRREYNRLYMNKRYKEDEEFRNKIKERSRIWKNNRHQGIKT